MKNIYYKIGWQALILIIFWGACVCVVALSALPRNAISFPYVPKLIVKTIIPEGWSFFTRNPREALVYIYKRDNDNINWIQADETVNGAVDNFFGMSRKARAMGSEYALVFAQEQVKWDSCVTGTFDCVDESLRITVKNELNSPQLCGEYLFVSRKPVPWAWSASAANINMPYQYVLVNFECR